MPYRDYKSIDELQKLSYEELLDFTVKFQERAILASQERTKFIESSYDGYWDWNLETNYEYMSPRFWEIMGIDPRTKRHSPDEWKDLIFPEDLELATINMIKHIESKGEYPYSQEVRYKHANGSTVTVYCRGRVVEWSKEGKAIRMIGTHTDITNLKRAQIELQKASEFKSRFLSHVSDELRTPLNSMMLLLKLLHENKNKRLTPSELEQLSIVINSAQELEVLIGDLLDQSKIEKGILDVYIEKKSVCFILNKIKEMFAAQFEVKKVELKFKCLCDADENIVSDYYRIEQILRNLLSNALKFTNPGGCVTVEAKVIRESSNSTNKMVEFKVIDQGIGIAEKDLAQIFENFTQLPEGRQRRHQGTGLGLAICKHLASILSGKLVAESTEGVGSTFTLTLPDLREQRNEESSVKHKLKISKATKSFSTKELNSIRGKTVLIVDDDVKTIFALRQHLLNHRMQVLQANSGEKAINIIKSNPDKIFAALIDIMMPGINGYETVEKLKDFDGLKNTKFIAISGHASSKDPDYLNSYFNDFIPKPMNIDSVLEKLIAHVGH